MQHNKILHKKHIKPRYNVQRAQTRRNGHAVICIAGLQVNRYMLSEVGILAFQGFNNDISRIRNSKARGLSIATTCPLTLPLRYCVVGRPAGAASRDWLVAVSCQTIVTSTGLRLINRSNCNYSHDKPTFPFKTDVFHWRKTK